MSSLRAYSMYNTPQSGGVGGAGHPSERGGGGRTPLRGVGWGEGRTPLRAAGWEAGHPS